MPGIHLLVDVFGEAAEVGSLITNDARGFLAGPTAVEFTGFPGIRCGAEEMKTMRSQLRRNLLLQLHQAQRGNSGGKVLHGKEHIA